MEAVIRKSNSPSLDALQSLFEQLDSTNKLLPLRPNFDLLLEHTHTLTHTMSDILNNLLMLNAGSDKPMPERLLAMIDLATESLTTLRQLMLAIHYMRRSNAVQEGL